MIAVFTCLISYTKCQERVSVTIPKAEEEIEYIWRNIQDTQFFDQNGYKVTYPRLSIISRLQEKVRKGQLSHSDYKYLEAHFMDSVYSKKDYRLGLQKVEKSIPLINTILKKIEALSLNWEFETHPTYNIRLTLYGPGGSYEADTGEVILFTTNEGNFKQYRDPENTIIHEITHIGIEKTLIQRYQVPHAMKERIVDLFVLTNFRELLPLYIPQNMGDERIDPFMNLSELKDLDRNIESLLNE